MHWEVDTYPLSHQGGPDLHFSFVVELLSHILLLATAWTTAFQASLSITISRSLLILMSIESMVPFNHPLSSPFPAVSLSQHQGLFK